jgi:signal transduction histidine kinase/CheY-like chemotaxis protein/HPt (histidine-containing phosphotransfer) domain-containing protein
MGGRSVKKTLIIVTDLVIMGLILFFIIQYANTKMNESNKSVIEAFEKMTVTAEQIITNYLEDEQHLCDIWSNYINRSAEAGTPMTAEEAVSFIGRANISPVIYGHLIFPDDPSRSGISTHPGVKDPDDHSVSYRNINLFDDPDAVSGEDGVVNLTRAYTNPQNGIQSIAFMKNVTVLDAETDELKKALLMRVEPVSVLEDKLVFLNGEYESVEISIINKDGDYVVHGKSMKNANFFEYYKSYNHTDSAEYRQMTERVTSGYGTMTMLNSKKEECVISYTPLTSMNTWFLLAYIPAGELAANTVVDWLLLGTVALGLLILLVFNFLILALYNRKLAEAAEAANQANEAKSHFLSTMSHDIRTPMNAILGLNEMVLRDSRDEEITAYSESIRTAGKTLLGLINDILDFSKIEAGKMDIINVDYSFVSLLNDLVNMVQGKAADKGLALNLDIDRDIPMILNGDEIRIKQIITNILSNAVKYTKEGSITLKAGFEKLEEDPGSVRLLISVTDTGIGIKPEDLKRLFVAFERIEEKRNRNIEGTGLGMSIAQSFLAMMGSHIEVESEYGKGSTFSFALVQGVKSWNPIGDYEESFKRSVSERAKYRERFTAPYAKLLVADDTPVNLSVFRSLLKRTKVQIDTAGSGDEAIAFYRQKHYDVIFLDHMMPDKDGIETLKEMKDITGTPNSETPVVCLTANAISGMREMYISAGFDDYLTKPIDPDRLETLLLQYIPKGKIAPAADEDEEDDYFIPDFIFKLDDLDVNSGLIHCGSRESYMVTLKMYLDAGPKNADDIEKYWSVRDLKNTTVKVHALKSTSRVIGALKLGDFAARLEKAGDSGDTDTLEREIGDLLAQYRELVKELEPLNDIEDGETEDDRPLISEKDMKEAYTALEEFCASFDYDSVVNIVESLENYRFPEEEATRFDAVKKAVDNFDYDLIPGILSGGEG